VKARLLAAAMLAAAFTAPAAHAATTPSQMAVLTADSGTLRGSVLTLRGVSPTTTWFDDRPYRAAGIRSTWRLVPEYFDAPSPPNAAIELRERRGGNDTMIVELRHPSIDAKHRTLRFAARVLPEGRAGLQAWHERRLDAAPRAFGQSTVFLDSAIQRCNAGVTLPPGVIATEGTVQTHYGDDPTLPIPDLVPGLTNNVVTQSGSAWEGCGGTITYLLQAADANNQPIPNGESGVLTLRWGNPQVGSDSASCTSTYTGLTCNVGQGGGDVANWGYTVSSG
jgi:hypothetical protein